MSRADDQPAICSQCTRPAEHIIVYGCLEGHLYDTLDCGYHMRQLTGRPDRVACLECGDIIAEYQTKPVNPEPGDTLETLTTTTQQLEHGIITLGEAMQELSEMLGENTP